MSGLNFVTSTSLQSSSTPTTSPTISAPVSSVGDLLIAVSANNNCTALTDTQGNTWTRVAQSPPFSTAPLGYSSVWLCQSAKATGANTLTFTCSSAAFQQMAVLEYSSQAASALDFTVAQSTTSTSTTVSAGPGTSTQTNETILFVVCDFTQGSLTSTSGQTVRIAGSVAAICAADSNSAVTGTFTETGTLSATPTNGTTTFLLGLKSTSSAIPSSAGWINKDRRFINKR